MSVDIMLIKILDDGYSMREVGRKAGAYQANGDMINVVTVESLKDGDDRIAFAEKSFEYYLYRKTKQGYRFEDLEATKKHYMTGFLGAYDRVTIKRRQLAARKAANNQ